MTKSTIAKVREALHRVADTVGRKKSGELIARREFFYTHGYTAERFAADIKGRLERAGFTVSLGDSGEVWKPFRGGATTAQSSHWYAEFTAKETAKPQGYDGPEMGVFEGYGET